MIYATAMNHPYVANSPAVECAAWLTIPARFGTVTPTIGVTSNLAEVSSTQGLEPDGIGSGYRLRCAIGLTRVRC